MFLHRFAWSRKLLSLTQRARGSFRLLRRNPLAFAGIAIVLGILIVAVLAPILAPPNPTDHYQRPRTWLSSEPPGTPGHLLGTGVNGADIYYGIIWGTRVSLGIAGTVVGISALVGVLLGGIAGYFGRWIDETIMRVSDLFISVPGLIMAMAVVSALGRSLLNIMLALVIIWWPWYVRIFRSQVLVTKQELYIDAARCSGASQARIMFRHVVPNSLTPVAVQASLDMGVTLLIAAGLSFIGFGAEPGFAEWGLMIAEGRDFIAQGFWWMVLFPGLAISIFVLGFNLLGDGLRDTFDPKLRSLLYESAAIGRAERRSIRNQTYRGVVECKLPRTDLVRQAEPTPLIRVENLTLRFPTIWGEAKVLENVSFEIRRGETFGLVGETGCGKSVTAKTIIGLIDRPPARIVRGRIWYFPLSTDRDGQLTGIDLLTLSESELAKLRGCDISMIFQDPMNSLNPVIRVGDQIAESLLIHRRRDLFQATLALIERTNELSTKREFIVKKLSEKGFVCSRCREPAPATAICCRKCNAYFMSSRLKTMFKLRIRVLKILVSRAARQDGGMVSVLRHLPFLNYEKLLKSEAMMRAVDLIVSVRIPDAETLAERFPFELSGGMQQRISIAMALACRPSLLIADEPTTALDVTVQAQILKLISELKGLYEMSVALISHNLGIIAMQCDRVGVMYAGSIAEIADVKAIFKKPMHPYTQGLIDSIPVRGVTREELPVIPGRLPDLKKPPTGCRFWPRCTLASDRCTSEVPSLVEIEHGHWVACHLCSGDS